MIRNAGGVASDDAIRSLAISQRLLGTREIVLVHHTDCGMLTFTDEQFAGILREDTGEEPTWAAHAFTDLDDDVRRSIETDRSSPFVPHTDRSEGSCSTSRTARCARSPASRTHPVGGHDLPAALEVAPGQASRFGA